MANYSDVLLSGSTNGRNIKVAATATPGTLIHTAHATALDHVILEAINTSATARVLTIERGGVTDPDDLCEITIPAEGAGWIQIDTGEAPLTGSVVVRAFCAAAANVINVKGGVRRVT